MRPNLLSYNTVINSWAKSSLPESASRAETLLTRMLKRYKSESFSTIKPDVVTFSSVLNALAKSKVQHKGILKDVAWLKIVGYRYWLSHTCDSLFLSTPLKLKSVWRF